MGVKIFTHRPTMQKEVTLDGKAGDIMVALINQIRGDQNITIPVVDPAGEYRLAGDSDIKVPPMTPMENAIDALAHSMKALEHADREMMEMRAIMNAGEETFLELQLSRDEWRERALKAESINRKAEDECNQLKWELNQFIRQGGTVNMERSWKSKYRNALAEANQRLVDNDLDPVRIRKREEEEATAEAE